MADLFSGTPVTTSSSGTTAQNTPQWMLEALYNQVNRANALAQTPYQPYTGQRVADLTPMQQQAYTQIQGMQGQFQPLMQESAEAARGAIGGSGLAAAQPYLQAASGSSAQNVQSYMNPFVEGVLNTIASRGQRNLTENLLPSVSDAFVKAGQFGGTRMGEFGSRALRDTQESILAQQRQALMEGWQNALTASGSDLSRQMNLGQLAGQLSGADLTRMLQGAQQLGNTAEAQQKLGLTGATALEAAGKTLQEQEQARINAAYQQFQEGQQYPYKQVEWLGSQLSGAGRVAPTVTTRTGTDTANTGPSPLSKLASSLSFMWA